MPSQQRRLYAFRGHDASQALEQWKASSNEYDIKIERSVTPYSINLFGQSGVDSPLTNMFGVAHFWVRLPPLASTAPLQLFSATATDLNGSTSEIGPYVLKSEDMIFRDDFKTH